MRVAAVTAGAASGVGFVVDVQSALESSEVYQERVSEEPQGLDEMRGLGKLPQSGSLD